MRKAVVKLVLLAVVLAGPLVSATIRAEADERVKRGEYLATIMDCGGCHTPGHLRGKPDLGRYLAGSDVGFEIPGLGIFYPPNLTPDRETGLGAWSEAEIITAIRTGARPDGRVLVPVMPYHSYAKLSDADARSLVAYLKSLKPIRNQAPAITGPTQKPVAPYLKIVMPE
jgi:mono/diheme cytochrome c family protein